jgi:GrpB-like predicted nucleotidyltransferase (UPF0157 family)
VDGGERSEHFDRVLIGGREKREIVIADYDSTWPSRFEHERERIQRALGPTALRVEHIGSTAVPGLAGPARSLGTGALLTPIRSGHDA